MIQLPEWLQFGRKNKKDILYDYEFEDIHTYESGETHAGVRILNGPYKGLLYAYKKVQLITDDKNDTCTTKFEWVPFQNCPESESQDLYDALGDILMDIMDKNPPNSDTMAVSTPAQTGD